MSESKIHSGEKQKQRQTIWPIINKHTKLNLELKLKLCMHTALRCLHLNRMGAGYIDPKDNKTDYTDYNWCAVVCEEYKDQS